MGRWKCWKATGLSNAGIHSPPCSRWWDSGAALLLDISNAAHRAIHPRREIGDGLGRAGVATTRVRSLSATPSIGSRRFDAATDCKLPDRTLDVKFDAGHLREQIDIGDADCAAAEFHVGRHQVERLHQHPDVLEDERIGERAVFP